MGWLIAGFILVGLAIIPLHLIVLYNYQGFFAQFRCSFLRIMIYPREAKKKRKKKTQKSAKEVDKQPAKAKTVNESVSTSGGSLRRLYPLFKLVLSFLNELRKKITVCNLELKIVLAGGDPCNLAVNYGRSWTSLGNLIPLLENYLNIKKRNLEIECNFEGFETTVYTYADIKITLGRSLYLLTRYGFKLIKELLAIKNTKKGGVQV